MEPARQPGLNRVSLPRGPHPDNLCKSAMCYNEWNFGLGGRSLFSGYSFSNIFSLSNIIVIFIVLFSLVIHEFAHAVTADVQGDDTARQSGRLTLNPIAHLDLLGIIMIIIVGIGWARPVPINAGNFKRPRLSMILSVAAGPLSNIVLVILSYIVLASVHPVGIWSTILYEIGLFNCYLFILNILPIPPLDGSQILRNVLPYRQAAAYSRLDPYGPFILLFLFIIPYFWYWLFTPVGNALNGWIASWFL